jgi:WD40 repeat protein
MLTKNTFRTLALFVLVSSFPSTANADLFVGNFITPFPFAGNVLRFDGTTGQPLGVFAGPAQGLTVPGGLTFGPDGLLYVASRSIGGSPNQILRFAPDGSTSEVFAVLPQNSFLNGIAFGPNGDLFVVDRGLSQVLRFRGATGESLGAFASVSAGTDLAFGPNGDLFVSQGLPTGAVARFDGATGAPLGLFVSGLPLRSGSGLTFGPDGNLYVGSGITDQVLRYDGSTGAFLGVFASGGGLDDPGGVRFGPDGNLYVASTLGDEGILRYDGSTGAFLGVFASGGGLGRPFLFAFEPASTAVPEPGTLTLLAVGGLAVFGVLCRRRASTRVGQSPRA